MEMVWMLVEVLRDATCGGSSGRNCGKLITFVAILRGSLTLAPQDERVSLLVVSRAATAAPATVRRALWAHAQHGISPSA
jgi:hypothetical protein